MQKEQMRQLRNRMSLLPKDQKYGVRNQIESLKKDMVGTKDRIAANKEKVKTKKEQIKQEIENIRSKYKSEREGIIADAKKEYKDKLASLITNSNYRRGVS